MFISHNIRISKRLLLGVIKAMNSNDIAFIKKFLSLMKKEEFLFRHLMNYEEGTYVATQISSLSNLLVLLQHLIGKVSLGLTSY